MQHAEFKMHVEGHIHHHAIVKLQDGSTKEGYMQPFDNERVYFTSLDGTSGGSALISDITSIEFPEGNVNAKK
jgi:hypothetical protein